MTGADFLTAAMAELNLYSAGDVPSGDDIALALLLANEVLDAWNGDEHALYTAQFSSFTLTPSLQPHTIGLTANSPTFAVTTNRPSRILGANLVLNTSTPNTNVPLLIRDRNWWLNVRVPTLTSGIPTDLYYEPDWPNGSIYLWPVPTTAYGIQLEIDTLVPAITLVGTLTLPPGYQQAFRLTVAESLVAPFGVPMPATLPRRAMEARARCWGHNDVIPRLQTATAGLQQGPGQRGTWEFRTGRVN